MLSHLERGGIRSAFILLITAMSFGWVQASSPNSLSVTWNLIATPTFLPIHWDGFAADNEIGHFFVQDQQQTSQSGRFNFTDQSWSPYPKLPHPITLACVVYVPNGDLYIIGGALVWADDVEPNATVYKLAANADSYTPLASMHVGRYSHRCAYDEATNRIYAIGGVTALLSSVITSGEYYSIAENKWTMIANKTDAAPYFAMINIGDGGLYTFNGFFSKDVKRYSIAENTWTLIGQMNINSYSQIAAYYEEENIIFLFGGPNSQIGGCEYFNLTSSTAVAFPCLDANNTSVYSNSHFGTLVPDRKTLYVTSFRKLWSANFSFVVEPTPEAVPASDEPSSPSAAPGSDSPNGGSTPQTSQSPSSSITSNAVLRHFEIGSASILLLALLSLSVAMGRTGC